MDGELEKQHLLTAYGELVMNITDADGVLDALSRKGGARSTTTDSDRPEALGLPPYGVEWYTDLAPRDELQFFEGASGTPTVIDDVVGPESEGD